MKSEGRNFHDFINHDYQINQESMMDLYLLGVEEEVAENMPDFVTYVGQHF